MYPILFQLGPITIYSFGAMMALAALSAGLVVFIASDVVLALATGVWQVIVGVALWGLHMGLTQRLLAALVADTTPSTLRGTAFGVFNLASGIAMLIASFLAGWLWDQYRPQATFYAGAGFTTVALLGLMIRGRGDRPGHHVVSS
jgi:MFS family permease